MELNSLLDFFTSKTGIIAALAVLVGLTGGILNIVLPLVKRRQEKHAGIPELTMSPAKVEDPPPWSEAGKAAFELVNSRGGKAVMSDLLLVVTECGASEAPKMVEAAAPVPQFSYKVTLSPGIAQYDVRKKEFGTPAPHSYEKGEIEAFSVELRSTKPQWYEFHFLVRWYDANKPAETLELRSTPLRIEFRPSIEELIGGK